MLIVQVIITVAGDTSVRITEANLLLVELNILKDQYNVIKYEKRECA
jgi:hypothetical protein